MIGFIVLIIFFVITSVVLIIRDEDIALLSCVGLCLSIFIFVILMLHSISMKRKFIDIRENPQMYTLYDAIEMNIEIKEIKRCHGTPLSFYNDVEIDYIPIDDSSIYKSVL